MNDDLKLIKKKYGEKMMHMCREYFPKILETKGLLFQILSNNFNYSKYLYEDISDNCLELEFKHFIYSFIKEDNVFQETTKTPKELLEEAGYYLYECKTEEDINKFKKYYSKGEQICTFNGGRLKNCYVFFAIKKDVDNIKREHFLTPKRQDKYGTSVISIQFTKDEAHTLSIKNRYNHKVDYSDSTFSNNLDNIIPGLTNSFEKYYGIIQKYKNNGFEIPGYVRANDGKYYKYNCEIDNIYYCTDNIIIDNFEVNKLAKERYILIDNYTIDLKEKTIAKCGKIVQDSLTDTFKDIENIKVENIHDRKVITFKEKNLEDVIIKINQFNQIISYKNNNIRKIGDYFLYYNVALEDFIADNATIIGNCFLYANKAIKILSLPNIKEIRDYFMFRNNTIEEINLESLHKVYDSFLYYNTSLIKFNSPLLYDVGEYYMCHHPIYSEYIKNDTYRKTK